MQTTPRRPRRVVIEWITVIAKLKPVHTATSAWTAVGVSELTRRPEMGKAAIAALPYTHAAGLKLVDGCWRCTKPLKPLKNSSNSHSVSPQMKSITPASIIRIQPCGRCAGTHPRTACHEALKLTFRAILAEACAWRPARGAEFSHFDVSHFGERTQHAAPSRLPTWCFAFQ